jgi:hypothetical protein
MKNALVTLNSNSTLQTGKSPPPHLRVVTYAGVEEFGPETVFIKNHSPFPEQLKLRTKQYQGWQIPQGLDGFELERQLNVVGWHLLFFVPALIENAIGFGRETAKSRAIGKVLRKVDKRGFNAAEITSLSVRSFLGIFRARVTAHPRTIRDNPYWRDPNPDYRFRPVSDFRRLFAVMNSKGRNSKAM